ncbi:phosphatidate cytidylyltransferase [Algihabitans sp.]|uniref:phosphatidate cytidylyltransferase n=1 Tax=Algihabitans sp. TaxID=2821514 RepID=UPI003BAC7125
MTVRVLSALVLGPPVLLLLWLGPPWTDFLLFGAAGIMVWEWARMCGARSIGWLEAVSILAVTTAVTVGALQGILTAFAVVALGASAAAATAALRRTRDAEDGSCAWFGLGVVYVAVPLLAFQWLRGLENGQSLIVWLVLVVWATDIGAFAVGRTLRGPKLWPAVSPSKTWAGAFGGLLAAGSVGLALFELLETRSFAIAILVATATSIAAQMVTSSNPS